MSLKQPGISTATSRNMKTVLYLGIPTKNHNGYTGNGSEKGKGSLIL